MGNQPNDFPINHPHCCQEARPLADDITLSQSPIHPIQPFVEPRTNVLFMPPIEMTNSL